MKDHEKAKKIIEVLLFVAAEPLSLDKISQILEMKPPAARNLIFELKKEYWEAQKGLDIIEIANGYEMCTRHEYSPWIERLKKQRKENKLSPSALETLAIIAYKQPITRLEIDNIRGVNSIGVVQTLLDKKLIKLVGRKDVPGKPLLYSTTLEFLKTFGLPNLSALPQIDELIQ
ncbi:MAG: SMC-Scp complex subunit ScpB [bacterium]|nr:SMC-Scp complex subunit ScpB [bacterium]